MDLAASLPIRRRVPRAVGTQGRQILLEAGYKEVFKVAAEELYRALLNKSRTAKAVNSLGTDTEYWTQAANIILRAKDDVLSKPAKSA